MILEPLKIRARDSGSDRFVLIAHWVYFTGEEGRKLGRLLDPNGWGPAYFVSQENLRKEFS